VRTRSGQVSGVNVTDRVRLSPGRMLIEPMSFAVEPQPAEVPLTVRPRFPAFLNSKESVTGPLWWRVICRLDGVTTNRPRHARGAIAMKLTMSSAPAETAPSSSWGRSVVLCWLRVWVSIAFTDSYATRRPTSADRLRFEPCHRVGRGPYSDVGQACTAALVGDPQERAQAADTTGVPYHRSPSGPASAGKSSAYSGELAGGQDRRTRSLRKLQVHWAHT
jgi:hypothetical protein